MKVRKHICSKVVRTESWNWFGTPSQSLRVYAKQNKSFFFPLQVIHNVPGEYLAAWLMYLLVPSVCESNNLLFLTFLLFKNKKASPGLHRTDISSSFSSVSRILLPLFFFSPPYSYCSSMTHPGCHLFLENKGRYERSLTTNVVGYKSIHSCTFLFKFYSRLVWVNFQNFYSCLFSLMFKTNMHGRQSFILEDTLPKKLCKMQSPPSILSRRTYKHFGMRKSPSPHLFIIGVSARCKSEGIADRTGISGFCLSSC